MAKVFCSYSHKDERMRQQLGSHMAALIREGAITLWSDHVILPGENVDNEISKNLELADIILFLVSSDFIASNYCFDIEVRRALELHEQGKSRVVPTILRDCDWHHTPFGKLKAIPTDGRPIKSWPDRDKGYRSIVGHLRTLVAEVNKGSQQIAKEVHVDLISNPPAPPKLEISKLAASEVGIAPEREGKPLDLNGFLPQLAHLIEIVDDLDRHLNDAEHAAAGGKINYVFDENVFELFLRPQRMAEYVSLFHSSRWSMDEHSRKFWRNINAQSALLAGEYLFSGSLPGQEQNYLYITPWHRDELFHRSSQMIYEFEQELPSSDIVREFLFQMAKFRTAAARATGIAINLRDDDDGTGISADIQTLREAGVPEDQLGGYLRTRVALRAIASEDRMMPMIQLQRMMSPDFFSAIRPIHHSGAPGSDGRRILADAEAWFARLQQEATRQHHDSVSNARRRQPGRPFGSLRNDALALAAVESLARDRQKAGELTVLVTGDALLYSAYRRWHLANCPDAPFLLRRVTQYAPVFSLGDREVVILPRPGILDEFLDMSMFPFNLSHFGGWRKMVTPLRGFAQSISDGAIAQLGGTFETMFSGVRTIRIGI